MPGNGGAGGAPAGGVPVPTFPTRRQRFLMRLLGLYPPFLGAGIRVRFVPGAAGAAGERSIEVRMRLTFWNRNYVGTHFGGSLYSMCDPFFMLILIQKLGRGYVVWDKWASIRFLRPGRGTVKAVFHIPDQQVEEIRARADRGEKVEPRFSVPVLDREGQVVAEVEKLLYVRSRPAGTTAHAGPGGSGRSGGAGDSGGPGGPGGPGGASGPGDSGGPAGPGGARLDALRAGH